MKKLEFDKLKVGDCCYLRDKNKKYTMTQVLSIDRIYNKIIVILHSKPVSYKYIVKKLNNNQEFSGCVVGSYKK